MSAASNILISGGVAGMLAAVIGGRLKAFGVEFEKVVSARRQQMLFAVALALLGLGLLVNEDISAAINKIFFAPAHEILAVRTSATGTTVIDFRPAMKSDGTTSYLLVTTDVAVQNPAEATAPVLWSGSSATLVLEGARIPLRAMQFTNLNNTGVPWTGENSETAGPVSIAPGAVVKHDLMFTPTDTGTGRYSWDSFLKAVLANPNLRPRLEIDLAVEGGAGDAPSIKLQCTAQVPEIFSQIKRDANKRDKQFWISAECTN